MIKIYQSTCWGLTSDLIPLSLDRWMSLPASHIDECWAIVSLAHPAAGTSELEGLFVSRRIRSGSKFVINRALMACSKCLLVLGVWMITVRAAPAMPPSGIAAAEPAHGARRRTDVYGDPLPLGAITRMGTFRFWVKTPISSITFSPDGKSLAGAH